MINLKIKDKELAARPETKKWIKSVEDIMNNKFPEEKLVEMRSRIAVDLMLYGNVNITELAKEYAR